MLDGFAKEGKPSVNMGVLAELNPTPDTLEMATLLVHGYLRKYPSERWPVERAEQPLRFPIGSIVGRGIEGLAKLDGYIYVPEDSQIESGIPNQTLTLTRGWWPKEYKTKAFHRKRSEWMKEWQTKRQADFQILALQHHLESQPRHRGDDITVQGILVCVLEKPHEYTPTRKCAGCKESYELMSFIPKPDGFMCPMCGAVQKLSPYIPKRPKVPEYFRLTITRTPEQLEIAKREISAVANMMAVMRVGGMDAFLPNRDACVNNVHRHECEYLGPHTYGGTTADGGYVQIDATKYMGVGAAA
jgi:hypothetical protein